MLLRGHGVPEQFAALSAVGAQPLFTFGALDDAGHVSREPAYPAVPNFAELYAARIGSTPSDPLCNAWSAAAAATQLEFGLVLPQLTPAAMVALVAARRCRCRCLAGRAGDRRDRRCAPAGGPAATANTAALAASVAALHELRRWLASRFNWRPA